MSFSVDKVTTRTYNVVSVIWNSNSVAGLFARVLSAKTQFLEQVKINSISQLIVGIFKVAKCFSVITNSFSFLSTLFDCMFILCHLRLSEWIHTL